MGFPTKVQLINRKASEQWYINFPSAIAQAMEFAKGETVEWVIEDKALLALRRLEAPAKPFGIDLVGEGALEVVQDGQKFGEQVALDRGRIVEEATFAAFFEVFEICQRVQVLIAVLLGPRVRRLKFAAQHVAALASCTAGRGLVIGWHVCRF